MLVEGVLEAVLHPAVQDRVRRLVDQQRRAELLQRGERGFRLLRRVVGNARVKRLPRPDGGVEGAHRLLDRRLRVRAVRVEDVEVVQAGAREALVQAGEEVLARAPLAVRAVPHQVARLGRHQDLVAVRAEVGGVVPAEVRLGRAGRRAVVVGQVEVRHAEVERPAQHRALDVERLVVPEVVPQAERHGGQLQPAAPGPPVRHVRVPVFGGGERRHGSPCRGRTAPAV